MNLPLEHVAALLVVWTVLILLFGGVLLYAKGYFARGVGGLKPTSLRLPQSLAEVESIIHQKIDAEAAAAKKKTILKTQLQSLETALGSDKSA